MSTNHLLTVKSQQLGVHANSFCPAQKRQGCQPSSGFDSDGTVLIVNSKKSQKTKCGLIYILRLLTVQSTFKNMHKEPLGV